MKLLFCIKTLNNAGGGAERVLVEVARGLAVRGHDVAILSFDKPGGQSYYPLHPAIKRIELGLGSTTRRATTVNTMRRVVALRREIRAYQPQVAIGFMHSMFIPLGLAAIGLPVPIIGSEHILAAHYRSRRIESMLLQLVPFLVVSMTCVSDQVRRSFSPWLARKMVVIPNPVTVQIEGRADVVGAARPRKTLLTVGRLAPQKDHRVLIDAFAQIARKVPDWDLRIVGDGELQDELMELVVERGLQQRVQMPGGVKNIAKEYLSAQLFVLSSSYESFGLTTMEALAHGLPAVGFDDCAGTNELIRPNVNGLLVKGNGDRARSLAHALQYLMLDDSLRVHLSQKLQLVPEEYQIDSVVNQWGKLLESVR